MKTGTMAMGRARKIGKAIRLLGHPWWRHGLRHGIGATVECAPLLRPLSPKGIIDVGAHKGQFGLLAAALFPDAVIHAFEAQDDRARRLPALFARHPHYHAHATAVGAETGTAWLEIHRQDDCSSLLPMGPTQRRELGARGEHRREVSVIPLDSLPALLALPEPVLLKIDVQGFEGAVLKGASALLAGPVRHVLVEVSFVELYEGQPLAHDITVQLLAAGFTLRGMGPPWIGRDGTCLQTDLLFSR